MKPRILILNASCLDIIDSHHRWIESMGAQVLAQPQYGITTPAQTRELLRNAEAVILPAAHPWAEDLMADAPHLKIISIAASGYEWIDLNAATRQGIAVTNAPADIGAEVVADLTWGLLLGVARQIPFHHQSIRESLSSETINSENEIADKDSLNKAANNYHAARHRFFPRGIGVSVHGKTLGIIGLGKIGRAVARRAAGFDMRVLVSTPHPDDDFAARYGIEYVAIDDLLRQSDYISLHARLNAATHHLIGERELHMFKQSAFLINTARTQLVDETALAAVVLEGRIAGVALDDPPSAELKPLLELPNAIFTNHLGNRAREGMDAVLRCAIKNVVDYCDARPPKNLLNPEVLSAPALRIS